MPVFFAAPALRHAYRARFAALALAPLLALAPGQAAAASTVLKFKYTGAVQTYTYNGAEGPIDLKLTGASGGLTPGCTTGLQAAVLKTNSYIWPGDVLSVYVGGAGGNGDGSHAGGGGGGTFVIVTQSAVTGVPRVLAVAGGSGGCALYPGSSASVNLNGNVGGGIGAGAGGVNGGGGAKGDYTGSGGQGTGGAGGGGWAADGQPGNDGSTGGGSLATGFAGGLGAGGSGNGGYGGGGGGAAPSFDHWAGGGAGGYSGGGGGAGHNGYGGGGGGSFAAGSTSTISFSKATSSFNGSAVITLH